MIRRSLPYLAALLALLFIAAPARASTTNESIFQDDNQLLYDASPQQVVQNMETMKALGVDRIRLTFLWKAIAPNANSTSKPLNFDAADPVDYGPKIWVRYDTVVYEAQKLGLKIDASVTGPGPLWAMEKADRSDIADTYKPKTAEWAAFVHALATRYNGTFPIYTPLPKIDYWTIWNEPNQSGWLTPQWEKDKRAGNKFVERSPVIYRNLVDTAYTVLTGLAGHGSDTILIGETAPKGNRSKGEKRFLSPMVFTRILYCLDAKNHALKGKTAQLYGCPGNGNLKTFAAAHPGLYKATGFAHHPYDLLGKPDVVPTKFPDYVTISSLGRLTKLLDKAFKLAGSSRKIPLYLTEFGWQTNPPDPLAGVKPALQQQYMDQSEYIAYKNKRVKALAQFQLRDDKALASFQSGLEYANGKKKPAFSSYPLPVWLSKTKARKGTSLPVWAMLRPAVATDKNEAVVQFKADKAKKWTDVTKKSTKNVSGYVTTSIKMPGKGSLRIKFVSPSLKKTYYSRTVALTTP